MSVEQSSPKKSIKKTKNDKPHIINALGDIFFFIQWDLFEKDY